MKVIWHKAASPPHTNGSVVFTRWRQYAPHIYRKGKNPDGKMTIRWIFGQPSVKRFVLCYLTVVCPVCDVGVLWPNGWMDQDLSLLWPNGCMDQDAIWYGGRLWRPHCVRQGPSSPKKGHSPQFSAHVCCGQRLDGSKCHLVWRHIL